MKFNIEKKLLNILILFGGKSSEHEISRLSASSILAHIDSGKYNIHKIGITKEGSWIYTKANSEEIANGSWQLRSDNKDVSLDLSNKSICIKDDDITKLNIDCCFPVLHGKNGEDGVVQNLMELLDIKYVSSRPLASAIAMDKAMTKIVVSKQTNIKQAKYYILTRQDFIKRPLETLDEINAFFESKYPLFVKPSNGGSSIGISKVKSINEVFDAIKKAFDCDNKIVIEEGICGREIEVGILGNNDVYATRLGEILTDNEMYDYDSKYLKNKDITKIVDDIDEVTVKKIQESAKTIYKVIGCKSLSRVDFFYTKEGELIFNEINTIPGFTKNSMYPKLWEDFGFSYLELIDKLIELGMEEI